MKQSIDLDKFILDLKKRQEQLLSHYDDVTLQLEEVSNQLEMAETVRDQIHKLYRLPESPRLNIDPKLQGKYAQLTIKDMLVRIAAESDGVLDLGHARKVLVRAGVFRDERNAATSMSPILSRHEDTFRRLGRGCYLLIQPQLESIPTNSSPGPVVNKSMFPICGASNSTVVANGSYENLPVLKSEEQSPSLKMLMTPPLTHGSINRGTRHSAES